MRQKVKLNVKLIGAVLGGLLLASGAVHLLHVWQLRQNAYRLLERGDRSNDDKDFEKALLFYAQYLSFVPQDADTAQKYALVLDRLASGAERIDLVVKMEQVLYVKPNEYAFRMRLAQNLILLERYSEAIDHLKKLSGHWSDQAELLHLLGWCQDAKKDYTQAVATFREALKLNPHQIKSWLLLAEVLQDRLNQPDEAAKAMNAMVQANEDSYQAFLLRSRFHRRRSREKEARADLEAARKRGPHQPEVILEGADWARTKGDLPEATRLLADGVKRYPQNADFYMKLAVIKIQREKRGEAIAHLQEGLAHAPKSTDLTVLLVDLMIDQKQYPQARGKIQELVDAGIRPTLTNYLAARLRMADKQWSEAIKLLEGVRQELGSDSEWNSRVNLLLGLCHRQLGDREQELLSFRRAVAGEPTWIVANLGLGSALLNNGRVEEAALLLEPLRKSKDLLPEYWLLLAKALLERQLRTPEAQTAWDKTEEALARAEEALPKSVEVPILRAEMLAARKQYAAAMALMEQCKADHPSEIAVWCALADLAARQDQWSQAEAFLDQAEAQKEFGGGLALSIAKVRLWSRHGTDADLKKLARLGDAADKNGSAEARISLRRELADVWYRLGNWTRAERFWQEIAQELPKDLPSRSWLLTLALDKNEKETARKWWGELRKIEGDQGGLWRYGAAAILVNEALGNRKKLDEARRILKDMKQHHQDWPRVALLSATICEMQGEYQKAIQEYVRALDMGEMQPRMMTRLLELLLERRDFGKAEAVLARYEQKLPLTKDLARLGAEVALGMGDKAYARVALRRANLALAFPLRDYRDLLWLAHIHQAAGDNAEAEKLLENGIALAGHTPDTWIALVDFFAQTNRRDQALKTLERLRKELPKDRQPLTVARCLEAMHLSEAAAGAYESALLAAPDDFTLLSFAADFYRRADRDEQARPLYERLLNPELAAPAEFTVKARRQLAILLASRGDLESCKKALALIDDVSKLRGETVAEERIRLYIQSQRPAERAAALNKFQESLPRQLPTPQERVLLAQMLEDAGNPGQARAQLSEVVDQFPTTPMYLVRLARVLIETGDLDEARRIVVRLESLEPGSARLRSVDAALTKAQAENERKKT